MRITNARILGTLLALLVSAPSAWAACGNGIVETGEDCDGGACCNADCSFTASDTVCREAVNPACDMAETCSGSSADCPADRLLNCSDTDGQDCTSAVCTPDGQCIEEETCTEICRGPGFWSTHAGSENGGENLVQSVLDQTGPLMICRRAVSGSDGNVGGLDSILEALCVTPEGVELRELYRQLAAANLNCAISEGGTCDQITRRFVDVGFDACNTLCAGEAAEGAPTVSECIRQLSCFNEGGRMVDGTCALGTCSGDKKLCGNESGDCSSGTCTHFADSCSDVDLCNTDLAVKALLCPLDDKRASSAGLCRTARSNACTIDQCDSGFDLLAMIAQLASKAAGAIGR